MCKKQEAAKLYTDKTEGGKCVYKDYCDAAPAFLSLVFPSRAIKAALPLKLTIPMDQRAWRKHLVQDWKKDTSIQLSFCCKALVLPLSSPAAMNYKAVAVHQIKSKRYQSVSDSRHSE